MTKIIEAINELDRLRANYEKSICEDFNEYLKNSHNVNKYNAMDKIVNSFGNEVISKLDYQIGQVLFKSNDLDDNYKEICTGCNFEYCSILPNGEIQVWYIVDFDTDFDSGLETSSWDRMEVRV